MSHLSAYNVIADGTYSKKRRETPSALDAKHHIQRARVCFQTNQFTARFNPLQTSENQTLPTSTQRTKNERHREWLIIQTQELPVPSSAIPPHLL
ncbi:hypothetical protein Q1695_009077 [Nippostrongylus brasiliensis]|nr:hypothetical protein Q1695_009077 [Nippostrongylus brasiliensis]